MDWVTGNESAAVGNSTEPIPPDLYNYWAWSIVDGALMVLIISGNTLTILAVTTSRRLSSLVSNQFVLNLAVSDLMVGLTLPYHLVFYLNDDFGKIKWSCLMRFILIILACLASIYNIIAIAVDRYIAIVHPLHYSRYMTKAVTRLLMSTTWSVAVCISCVPVFWNDWADGVACEMNVVVPKTYTTSILTPMFSLIWIAMFVLYWRIWREAACHARRLRANACCPGAANDWKSIQVVLLVLGSFSVCWMPFVVVACAQTLPAVRQHSPIAYRLTSSLAMSNSGVNPLIYAWKNAGFRTAFARLLRCRRPDASEYRGSPAAERKRGSVALREGSVNVSTPPATRAGRRARLLLPVGDAVATRCRVIENAGYEDGEGCEPAPVHGPADL
ncbi:octopamine receptor 1-like [Pieris brassicae]|uniref:G-protein coupled receptors family 1 profile domain-containing protein n=1 Tax=Pieris brassicae TaxID=7116 RepID=A0A9P0TIM8_PIEBR|nr:octopamine receptor 1-like [Pieris brassicae]XP_045525333.1 octopamine receptor 1-like [Pieris brassicae]XP_045525334.1 octopamine receptor 1-like [Pieris brassicae]XP_045525335.1 octopamine receptor 1-like [Pieris brassicae]XP_045525336.1 octopamine receptor 1-like [Pieris brassicae]XP_045525337.1 octopamine receptor 1-like [Pieris brassicae]XP_045525338.1 octopamine receptor 1-like [Pieris brassicae]XP_045525339.1 octopamine receptor 1-like [Pieris brassicae]CAH4033016.1 unnamed protei